MNDALTNYVEAAVHAAFAKVDQYYGTALSPYQRAEFARGWLRYSYPGVHVCYIGDYQYVVACVIGDGVLRTLVVTSRHIEHDGILRQCRTAAAMWFNTSWQVRLSRVYTQYRYRAGMGCSETATANAQQTPVGRWAVVRLTDRIPSTYTPFPQFGAHARQFLNLVTRCDVFVMAHSTLDGAPMQLLRDYYVGGQPRSWYLDSQVRRANEAKFTQSQLATRCDFRQIVKATRSVLVDIFAVDVWAGVRSTTR